MEDLQPGCLPARFEGCNLDDAGLEPSFLKASGFVAGVETGLIAIASTGLGS